MRTHTMSRFRQSAAVLVLAASASWVAAAPAANASKTLTVGSATVVLDWSPDWQLYTGTAGLPDDSIAFSTADATKMRALLTTGPMKEEIATDAGMKKVVGDMAARLEAQSVEKKIEVVRTEGAHARGYHACATDRAPKPGEYKFMCQGILNVDGTAFVFTILHNDSGKADADKVIAAMKTLQLGAKT